MHNVKVDSTPTNRDATSKRIPTHAPLPGNHQTVGMSCPPHVFLKSCSQAEPPEFQGNAGSTMAPDKAMTSTFGDGPRDLCSGLKIPALHDDHDRPSGLAVEPGLPGIAFSGLLPANCRAAGGRVSASLGMPRLIGVLRPDAVTLAVGWLLCHHGPPSCLVVSETLQPEETRAFFFSHSPALFLILPLFSLPAGLPCSLQEYFSAESRWHGKDPPPPWTLQ